VEGRGVRDRVQADDAPDEDEEVDWGYQQIRRLDAVARRGGTPTEDELASGRDAVKVLGIERLFTPGDALGTCMNCGKPYAEHRALGVCRLKQPPGVTVVPDEGPWMLSHPDEPQEPGDPGRIRHIGERDPGSEAS
jgi:hypothetical protein